MGAVPAEQLDEWQAGKHCFGTGSSAKLEAREEERAGAHRPAPIGVYAPDRTHTRQPRRWP
jgi:hypothetical protein